jgi:hypothetical protein
VNCQGNGRKILICLKVLSTIFLKEKIRGKHFSSNTILGKIRTLGISNAKHISTSNFYTWVEPRVIIFYFIDSKTA